MTFEIGPVLAGAMTSMAGTVVSYFVWRLGQIHKAVNSTATKMAADLKESREEVADLKLVVGKLVERTKDGT